MPSRAECVALRIDPDLERERQEKEQERRRLAVQESEWWYQEFGQIIDPGLFYNRLPTKEWRAAYDATKR